MVTDFSNQKSGQTDFSKYGSSSTSSAVVKQPDKPNLAQRIWIDLAKRGKNLYEEVTKPQNPIVGGFKATAQAFGGIGDVAIDVIKATPVVGKVAEVAENLVQKGFSKVTDRLSNTKLFQEAAQSPDGLQKLEDFLSVLSSSGEIAGNILGAEGVKAGIKTVATKAPQVLSDLYKVSTDLVKKFTAQFEKSVEKSVIKNYEKGIKPLLLGKTSPNKLANYREDVITAIKTINENKNNLIFFDDVEGTITGQTPKSLQQLSEALEQTKKVIFNKYDNLAKTAGEAGVGVEMSPIANELNSVIGSKAISITSPKTIQYAQDLQERLLKAGKLDASTAQEIIQNYNKSLEAFYRNPSYDTVSQAAIDAMVANRMRQALDEGISGLTGQQYSALKYQYGALKTIEKDVINAALRDARRNVKGLIDFSDILSGGQVVNGLLTLNPGLIAQGVVQKGIASYFKFINDPNRAVERMFILINQK